MSELLTNPFVLSLAWHSLILPVISTLLAGLMLFAYIRASDRPNIDILSSLPFLLGLLIGYFSVYRDWSLLPHTVLGWLPALAIATVLLSGLSDYMQRYGGFAAAVLVTCASVVMLKPIMSQMTVVSALIEWAWVVILWWWLWRGATSHQDDLRGVVASQIVLAAGLAVVGPLSQSILLGQLAMVLGASWAVVLFLSRFRPGVSITAANVSLATLILGILMIELWFYAAAPLKVVLSFLVSAVLSVVMQRYCRLFPARPLMGLLVPAAVTGLPVIIGLIFAWQVYSSSGGGY